MSGYLVDTDVLSEPEKPKPHAGAITWLREHEAELYTSAFVIGEIAWGIQRLAAGKKQTDLTAWLHDRVIPRLDSDNPPRVEPTARGAMPGLIVHHLDHSPVSEKVRLVLDWKKLRHAATRVEPGLGFEVGAQVTVSAIDYGVDPVAGALVGLSSSEVIIERSDERAGTVHVHFPRVGHQIKNPSQQELPTRANEETVA